jgi:hypothetical protein
MPAKKYAIRHSPEYRAYHDAKQRCTNSKSQKWKAYGGRGIEFRLASFDEFIAAIGPRISPSHSLDRIETNGHYEIGNIRWATRAEQIATRRLSGSALISQRDQIFFSRNQ